MEMEMIERTKRMIGKAMEQIDEHDLTTLEGARTLKNLAIGMKTLCEMGEQDSMRGYSRAGEWTANGYYNAPMGNPMYSGRRNAMGRYSRTGYNSDSYGGDREEIIEQLEEMAQQSGSPQEKNVINKFIREMQNMK